MSRVVKASLISLLFTFVGGSYYYLFALFLAIANHTSVVQAFADTLLGCFVCWLFLTFVFYEIQGAFDEINKPRDRNPEDGPKKD